MLLRLLRRWEWEKKKPSKNITLLKIVARFLVEVIMVMGSYYFFRMRVEGPISSPRRDKEANFRDLAVRVCR